MDIQTLRRNLIKTVLRIMLIGGGIGVVAATYYAYIQQDLELIPLYIGILAFIAVAGLWRGAPYAFQVWATIGLMYGLALLNLVTEGRGSLGRVFLIVGAFSATLFFGRRAIVPALAAVVLTMAGFAWVFTTDRMTGYVEVVSTVAAGWISNTVILTVVGVFVTSSINYIISHLTAALDQSTELASELRRQQTELEAQSAAREAELVRRSGYLGATTLVAEEAQLAGGDLSRLLPRVVSVISEQFGFYHTGLFLLDARREWAVLRAASSEGGRRMVARQHRLQVGGQSIVGFVAAQGERRIALDVGQDAVFFDNADLPETRSEMAVPLRVRGDVLGVLDVQSVEAQAFADEDASVLQALADQVAMAVNNARLLQQIEESAEAERRAMGELTREAWLDLLGSRRGLGFYDDGRATVPAGDTWRPEMERALNDGVRAGDETGTALALPIRARDQVIGVIDGRKPDGTLWTEDEINLLQALTDQLSTALEGAQLYEDSRQRAAREQVIGEVTGRIRQSLEPDEVLQTAASEIRQALDLDWLVVKLATPEMVDGVEQGGEGDAG